MRKNKLKLSFMQFIFFTGIFSLHLNFAYAENFAISILISCQIKPYDLALEGFLEGLEEKGYKENTNLNITYYNIAKKELDIIKEVKTKNPDLILTIGTEATNLAYEGIDDIPVVFSMVLNPGKYKVVKSMESLGNNFTGASMDISVETQFERLKMVMPPIKKIGVLYNPKTTGELIEEAKLAALKAGLELVTAIINTQQDVPKEVRGLVGKVDALWMAADKTVLTKESSRFILEFTLKEKIPCLGYSSMAVKAGALLALDCDYKDIGRQSGELACSILRGSKPYELPVTVPREILLVVNLKSAKWLGIEVPDDVLKKASEIFK
ncbi:MAG: ABC transporter substrate-binding protein [Candidatus Omnitrophica bacterium]|nr:ABC transporter substrate-binding protein [Candidatus Omnitrophota bacterium]